MKTKNHRRHQPQSVGLYRRTMAEAEQRETGVKCSACDGSGSWRGMECACVREHLRKIYLGKEPKTK